MINSFKKKKLIIQYALFALLFIGLLNITFAYTYTAPIEPDNKLTIMGETTQVMCDGITCKYNYSITNNDTISHLINITPYLNTNLKDAITTQQITYDTITYSTNECTKYETGIDENAKLSQICTKYEKIDKNYQQERIIKQTPTNTTQMPTTPITINNDKFKGTVEPKTTNQQTIQSGETLYFKIKFKPTTKTGELLLTAKANADPRIKASLDPSFNLTGLVSDFNFNEPSGSTSYDALKTNNGTIGAGISINQTGRILKGYLFHKLSATDYVTLANESNFDFLGDSNAVYSISTWFKTSDMVNAQRTIIGKYNGGASWSGYWLDFDAGRVALRFGDNTNNKNIILTHSANLFSDNQWHHLVFTKTGTKFEGSSDFNIYIDNNKRSDLQYTKTGNGGGDVSNALALNIGSASNFESSDSYDGNLDIIGIWTRVLTITDVNTLYNVGAGIEYPYGSTIFPKNKITFNVYRKNTATNLTNVTLDCNNGVTQTGQNSPFTYDFDTNESLLCDFDRTGYDSNNLYPILVDSNKTVTIYLNDSTAPIVGVTGFSGFKTSTTYIGGTGNIFATASDAGSGLASCDYNSTSISYSSADLNATHCYKNGVSIVNGSTYSFNLRAIDASGNSGVGTPTSTYTGDALAPITTLSYDGNQETGYLQVDLNCSDTGAGCKTITYKVDGGSWTYVTGIGASFALLGTSGTHTINYYSTDNLDINETTKNTDLNGFYLYTIYYPKNEETLIQITEKWRLTLVNAGLASSVYSDLTTDKNVFLQMGSINYLTVRDMNNNYFVRNYTLIPTSDGNLQPYLVSSTTGILTTINSVSATTNQPISGIIFKIYKNIPGLGNTLVEQITTDAKGQGLVLLVLNSNYVFDAYDGNTLIKSFNITATSSTIYFILDLGGTITTPIVPSGFTATWTPSNGLTKNNSGTQVFTQTLHNFGSKSVSITSTLTQNGLTLGSGSYSGSSDKTFSYTINWVDINVGTVISKMVIVVDGNTYTFTQNYYIGTSYGTNYNPIKGLQEGLRTDLACSSDPLLPCYPLLIVAILISIGLGLYASFIMGQFGGQSTGVIFLIGMILFTFLTWIPIWLTAGLVVIILAFLVNERRN